MSRRTLDHPRRVSPLARPAEGREEDRTATPASRGAVEDLRREPRRPARGLVVVRFGQPEREVQGRLVDISASGFRIAHDCRTLETGQTVEFSHPEAHGKARVVWNRIAISGVETGLVLVAS
jgi:hypothetical protein